MIQFKIPKALKEEKEELNNKMSTINWKIETLRKEWMKETINIDITREELIILACWLENSYYFESNKMIKDQRILIDRIKDICDSSNIY